MYGLNRDNSTKRVLQSAGKECAYLAVFVALVLVAQICLAAVAGVEVVTVLFIAFSFAFGAKRGMLAATVFSLLRQFVFGFFPNVLILYLVYYNLLTFLFGCLGKRMKNPVSGVWLIVLVACFCTVCFTMLDVFITPLWYHYTAKLTKAYFYKSLSVLIPHTLCTAVTVTTLFLPLRKVFALVRR